MVDGKIAQTHSGGGTLDVIMCDHGLEPDPLKVLETGIGGNDHAMVSAVLHLPGMSRPPVSLIWKPAPVVDWQMEIVILEPGLHAWHDWLVDKVSDAKNCNADMTLLLQKADILFCFIVLCHIWRKDSTCGQFTQDQCVRMFVPWWNTECGEALAQ